MSKRDLEPMTRLSGVVCITSSSFIRFYTIACLCYRFRYTISRKRNNEKKLESSYPNSFSMNTQVRGKVVIRPIPERDKLK